MTPLHWAAYSGHTDTVQFLIDKGADIDIREKDEVNEWDYTTDCEFVLLIRIELALVPGTWHSFWYSCNAVQQIFEVLWVGYLIEIT